jgi:hypothetical protein
MQGTATATVVVFRLNNGANKAVARSYVALPNDDDYDDKSKKCGE